MPIYSNILGTIGRTPVVKINRLAPAGIDMFVKCEFFNPLGSVKDRLAIAVIEVCAMFALASRFLYWFCLSTC
jgi:cysteine synthase A